MKVADLFATKTLIYENHTFIVRRPSNEEGLAWFNGLPALAKNVRGGGDGPSIEPAKVHDAIARFLVSVDGEPYDPALDPPKTFPFAVAVPLYNAIYELAVPQAEAEAAGRLLRG